MTDFFGDVIHSYTRADAIADGTLVDVTTVDGGSRQAGLRWPVAVSAAAYADAVRWDGGENGNVSQSKPFTGNSTAGRLWDLMQVARHDALPRACRAVAEQESVPVRVDFRVLRIPAEGPTTRPTYAHLSLCLGPGDDGEPSVTILLPHES